MKKIVIVDLWTNSNNGDEVLQSGLISMVRNKFPDATVSGVFRFGFNEFNESINEIERTISKLDLFYPGPRRTLYAGKNALLLTSYLHIIYSLYSFLELFFNLLLFKFKLNFILRKKVSTTFEIISDADIVIWKGKNYRDYSGLKGLFRQSTLLVLGFTSVLLNKNVFCINASIWPMKNLIQKKMLDFVFKRCRHVTVRDEDSLTHFFNYSKDHFSFCADLSFFDLEHNYLDRKLQGFNVEKIYDIAITLTEWGSLVDQKTYIKSIVELISVSYFDKGFSRIIIVPQVNRVSESNDNVKQMLYEQLSFFPEIKIEEAKNVHSIEELLDLYSFSKLLIGSRMHSCVFSFYVGTPFVAFAYDNGPKWSILRKIWPNKFINDYKDVNISNDLDFSRMDKMYYSNFIDKMFTDSYRNIYYVE
jgi:colanic acid/amylovoran biosynthesis protein